MVPFVRYPVIAPLPDRSAGSAQAAECRARSMKLETQEPDDASAARSARWQTTEADVGCAIASDAPTDGPSSVSLARQGARPRESSSELPARSATEPQRHH